MIVAGSHRWKVRAGRTWWREIPNPAAVNYVYSSPYTGGVRFTLFAIALEMPAHYRQTKPMLLERLMAWTRYTDRQTRDHLDALEVAGEIIRHRRGKCVSYEMTKFYGPLPFWASGDAAPTASETQKPNSGIRKRFPDPQFGNPEEISGSELGVPEEISGSLAATPLSVHKNHHHHDEDDDTRANSSRPELAAFVAWWRAEAPRGRGIRRAVTPAELPHLATLLDDGRTLEQLQAMAVALWNVTDDHDPRSTRSWIARSNRSVSVLAKAVDFLEVEAQRRSGASANAPAWTSCGHCTSSGFIFDPITNSARLCECRKEHARVS